MADIAGYYGAFCVEMQAHERPDHVAVEADFLWYLTDCPSSKPHRRVNS
jgi:hypothetical protein